MKLPLGLILGLTVALLSGCRDINLLDARETTEGYRIVGTVLDGLDNPIAGLGVRLSYGAEYVSGSPVPQREYILQSPGEFVLVDVYSLKGNHIRSLYAGTPAGTSLFVQWNKRNNAGALVPSGIYFVRYTVNGSPRHSYTVVVDGHVSATTDSNGVFIIPDDFLPVGYYPAPLYSGTDAFLGNHRIQNLAYLEFTVGANTYVYSVVLELNQTKRLLVRVQ